jgi:hypothetical protein
MKKRWLLLSVLLIVIFSLVACSPKPNWQEFIGPEGDFSIQLPGTPKESVSTSNPDIGEVTIHMFNVPMGKYAYVVAYSDYPSDFVQNNGAKKILEGARDGALSNTGGKLLEETSLDLNGDPGLGLKVESPDGKNLAQAKMYMVGTRLYQIFVAGPKDEEGSPDIQKYFESFKLNK